MTRENRAKKKAAAEEHHNQSHELKLGMCVPNCTWTSLMLAPHMPTNTEVAHLDFHGNPQGRTVQLISPPTTHCKLGKLSTQVWGPAGQDCARSFCPRAKGPQKLRRNTKMRVRSHMAGRKCLRVTMPPSK